MTKLTKLLATIGEIAKRKRIPTVTAAPFYPESLNPTCSQSRVAKYRPRCASRHVSSVRVACDAELIRFSQKADGAVEFPPRLVPRRRIRRAPVCEMR